LLSHQDRGLVSASFSCSGFAPLGLACFALTTVIDVLKIARQAEIAEKSPATKSGTQLFLSEAA
jgi:hypothetical protein